MNPLASLKCASRVLAALAAISGIIFAVGCGSDNHTGTINPGGFSNSSLNGTYVFSSSGLDSGGFPIAVAGALTANGSGAITGGTLDVVDTGSNPATGLATSGSYGVGADGRGHATLNVSGGSVTLDFVLTSTSHGLVTEFDGNGTGSGTLDLQTSVASLSDLVGPFAFGLSGIDVNGAPLATAGAFTLDSTGTITTGVQDFNDNFTPLPDETLTGAVTLGSGTAPGTITLTANLGSLVFDVFPIDATHWKLIETDFAIALLAGDAFTQTGAAIPSGQVAFTMSGVTSGGSPIANAGIVTSDVTGHFTAGSEDINNNGTQISQQTFSGTPAAGGSVGGRVIVNLVDFVPASRWVIYPSSGGLIILESDNSDVMLGTAFAQTSTTLTTTQGYGFNLSAFNIDGGFEEDDIAQFDTTSAGLTGVVDINDEGALTGNQALTGTLSAPDSTGRGTATTSIGNTDFVSFNYYVVNTSTNLVLETDSNQIGTGIFQLQSSPAGAIARPFVSYIRTAAKSKVAFRRK